MRLSLLELFCLKDLASHLNWQEGPWQVKVTLPIGIIVLVHRALDVVQLLRGIKHFIPLVVPQLDDVSTVGVDANAHGLIRRATVVEPH